MLKLAVPSAAVVLLCAAAPLSAQNVVSSFPEWDGEYGLTLVGTRVALGQTFTVPAGQTTLDAVRTRIDMEGSAGGNIRLYLYAMSGNQLTGAPLYRSDPIADPGVPYGTYTAVDVSGLGAAVTPGQTYVLFFSNVEGAGNAMTNVRVASTPSAASASPYLGSVVGAGFAPGGFDQLAGATFNTIGFFAPRDLIAELTFIPAPGAAAVLSMGVVGLLRRRR